MTRKPESMEELLRIREMGERYSENAAKKNYVPTPEQIREACKKIQEGWSKSEERKRRGVACRDLDYYAVELPVINVPVYTSGRPQPKTRDKG